MQKALKSTVEAIGDAQSVVLASHVNPDGDALGSVLALAHVLRGLGKEATVLLQDGVPEIYRWMPGQEWVELGTARRDFDLAIVCDAGALERVGRTLVPVVESAPKVINIDHHVADGPFGDVQVLDATAAATAEILWSLLRLMSVENGRDLVTREVAVCLMTGLITDTGSFRYMNVTPRTFELAADLQKKGALPSQISELVFENRSYASVKLLGRALDSLHTSEDGRVAWAKITTQDFADFGATDEDTEGIVNHVRAISGVQVGILFREVPGKKVRDQFASAGRRGCEPDRQRFRWRRA